MEEKLPFLELKQKLVGWLNESIRQSLWAYFIFDT